MKDEEEMFLKQADEMYAEAVMVYKPVGVMFEEQDKIYIAEKSKNGSCDGCDFYKQIGSCDMYPCSGAARKDKNDVVFKKVKSIQFNTFSAAITLSTLFTVFCVVIYHLIKGLI